MIAQKSSWKISEPPDQKEELKFILSYSNSEYKQIKNGFIPEDMEDKWFIYYKDNWLYFHRSWTGNLIYWIRFERKEDRVHVVESWTNKDPQQYNSLGPTFDQNMIETLVQSFLLKKE